MTAYTPEQQRVAKYIVELVGIGGGDDPIGFLIASHYEIARRLQEIGAKKPATYETRGVKYGNTGIYKIVDGKSQRVATVTSPSEAKFLVKELNRLTASSVQPQA